jgi:VanZ family protein
LISTAIFTFYCFFLLMLSFFKSAELFLPAIYQFEAWLGGDKLMHLKLAFVLSLLACFAANSIKRNFLLNAFWRLLFIQLFLASCLLLDEAHQYLAPSRRFELMDFYYGVGGLLIGLLSYCCFLGVKIAYKFDAKHRA